MSPSFQERERQPNPSWGGTTNPSLHNPDRFRYLVHAINPYSLMNALIITAQDARAGITYDKSWGDQSISMYEHPERIAERVSLSMSLIDQDHPATWGEAGLIIEAPEDNVILTETSDAGSHNNNLDVLLSRKGSVLNGDELLRSSSPHSYNEVVAIANHDGKQVQLKGFFYKTTSTGTPMHRLLANRMQAHAYRLGLPIVTVANKSRYAEEGLQRYSLYEGDKKFTALNFNGNRYLLEGFDDKQLFRFMDETGAPHFSAPHDFEAALGFAVGSGAMTQAEADGILQAYTEADKRRQTPTVSFDENGEFEQIAYYEGYGMGEFKFSLHKSGHGYQTNTALLAQKNQEAMLNLNPGGFMISSFEPGGG